MNYMFQSYLTYKSFLVTVITFFKFRVHFALACYYSVGGNGVKLAPFGMFG